MASTSPTPRWRSKRTITMVALGLAIVALSPIVWVQSARTQQRTLGTVSPSPVALVLGAGLWGGKPSPYLQRRLAAAAQLYQDGTVETVLVSGDRSGPEYDEPAAMKTWLLSNGVPESAIVTDPAGFDTHDSCMRAKHAFGVHDAIVISQDYHLPRALFLCERAGINAQGIGVSAASTDTWKPYYYQAREWPASWKAAIDGLTHREPAGGLNPSPTSGT